MDLPGNPELALGVPIAELLKRFRGEVAHTQDTAEGVVYHVTYIEPPPISFGPHPFPDWA